MNLDVLFHLTDGPESIATGLAETLTSLIRNNDSGGDNMLATTMKDQAFGIEQFVVVRWQWLILPLVETVLASALLVVSIVLSLSKKKTATPLLKTSVIAYLMYPMTDWTGEEMPVGGKKHTAGMLEDMARGMEVRFELDEGGGWRFQRA
ncbi:hypothetical protein B0H66DRAFT_607681 [Apodospora peruviana]|uniref:Uncharacterized protein n=1 Tax=Apodospora peruviana TaxID=516989 RepID=A0AAE0LYR4_9PEZI|nr:hypothetical protein B0H66DRAFT_607681 [Apodospora peruviana]